MADNRTEYGEPFKAFRFLIEFEDPASASGAVVTAAFSSFSGIRLRVDTIENRFGDDPLGTVTAYSGLTHYDNVTFSKGIIGSNEFMEWLYSVAPTEIAAPAGVRKYRTINVVALDDKGNRGITWTLYRCMPVSYQLSEFDASQSALLTESIEFSIGSFKRVVHGQRSDTGSRK